MSCDINAIEAARKDICYMSRASYILYLEITDADGNPVDLSAKDLIFEVKKRTSSNSSVAELTSTITITGGGNNIVGLPLDFDLEERPYYHGLKNITDDKPLIYGMFDVTQCANE